MAAMKYVLMLSPALSKDVLVFATHLELARRARFSQIQWELCVQHLYDDYTVMVLGDPDLLYDALHYMSPEASELLIDTQGLDVDGATEMRALFFRAAKHLATSGIAVGMQ